MLAQEERDYLLDVARSSMGAAVKGMPAPELHIRSEALLRPAGAFVTLRMDDDLRGCVGYVDPVKPLVETVRDVAAKAAVEDIRFLPVTADEIPQIWIEISVLSPLVEIPSPEEIEIGTHGLLLECGRYRGLLLPQVATEYNWDRETFLNQTARKAGLSPSAWKDPRAKIYVFTAEIFSERSAARSRGS